MLGLMKVEAYPDGAPSEACGNLFPKHDAKSQEGDPPYSVDQCLHWKYLYSRTGL